MNSALVKTEHVFLQGYNLFVKSKTSKMQELVDKFKERNTTITIKDEKINKLTACIHSLKDQVKILKTIINIFYSCFILSNKRRRK